MKFAARVMRYFGFIRATAPTAPSIRQNPYAGANMGRTLGDWIPRLLSADIEARGALITLRARSRELVRNNDYAERIVALIVKNVIGPRGIALEAKVKDDPSQSGGDVPQLADETNQEIKRSWQRWCRRGNCTVDGKMSFAEVQRLAARVWVTDGECFIRKVKGFPGNPYRFALQFIDADRVDANLNRFPEQAGGGNDIRMGVEVDPWRRPVAYYITKRHPGEGSGGMFHDRVPADEMIHFYVQERADQTRGIPLLHTAMSRMHMLGGYEEAELIASRVSACMMAFIQSKTGEEYAGGATNTEGAKEITIAPGIIEQLPQGMTMAPFNPTHPNQNYSEFVKRMLAAVAVGCNLAYTSVTGDLSQVNFSSIRQGVLDERDSYRVMQAFASEGLCAPVFEAWFDLALLSRKLALPVPSDDERDAILGAIIWQARGWTWVDPLKDVAASIDAIGAGLTTLERECSERGLDWREMVDQRAEEIAYMEKKGVNVGFKGVSPYPTGVQDETNPDLNPDGAPTNDGPQKQNRAHVPLLQTRALLDAGFGASE